MKQFNDITIIGIDQGYGNMKTANTIFPTAITAYDTAPMFKGDVLEYGGKFYRVGEGHKGFVADKSTDGDFYVKTCLSKYINGWQVPSNRFICLVFFRSLSIFPSKGFLVRNSFFS